jgi:hypothetical protein
VRILEYREKIKRKNFYDEKKGKDICKIFWIRGVVCWPVGGSQARRIHYIMIDYV